MNEAGMSLTEAWVCGGSLMWVLAGMSVLALALVLYVLIAHRREALAPRELVSDVLGRLTAKDFGEARRLCERRVTPFSALAVAALDAAKSGSEADVGAALETTGAHLADRLEGTTEYLADVGAVAPLVGLLGTVLGMFRAFGGIAGDLAANARPVVLAQGVSQAIITTVFGLMVAIPCLVAYALLKRRTARRVAELETLAVTLKGSFK